MMKKQYQKYQNKQEKNLNDLNDSNDLNKTKKENTPDEQNKDHNNQNKHFNRFVVFNAVDKFKADVLTFIETLIYTIVPMMLVIVVLILANAQELYLWEIIAAIGIYALVFELLFKRLQSLSEYNRYFAKKNADFNNLSKSDEKKLLRNEEVRYIKNKRQRRKQQEKKEKEDMLIKKEDQINNADDSLISKVKSVLK